MKTKVIAALLVLSAGAVFAQTVEVKDAWVRAAVPGQSGTGAFMSITAKEGTKLVGASSPVAGVAEVHEMKMEGDIMRMRAVPVLDLPAGTTVQLKPGGYHVMLMELRQALPKGSTVPLTLTFKDARGQESKVELKLPVAASAPGAAMPASGTPAAMHHKH
ncbi:copper chaperone PCu(A)C [Polaromonas sp.]|uniref:copper chaperone PCu(A)C n=1 Tax=Polaromonas sp. TaxID=1869339 RepID=UPI0024870F63|nr:copper chaperone PCu(A)C [Polaromonas sp.]MDI1274903.1 copper chaperone PCu(A)C [Polaromonas sp.]